MATLFAMKKYGLIRGVASLEGGNLLVLHLKSGLMRGVASLQRDNLLVLHLKSGPTRGVASLEGDNLLVVYLKSGLMRGLASSEGQFTSIASEICPDKRNGFWRGLPYKKGTTVLYNFVSLLLISS